MISPSLLKLSILLLIIFANTFVPTSFSVNIFLKTAPVNAGFATNETSKNVLFLHSSATFLTLPSYILNYGL